MTYGVDCTVVQDGSWIRPAVTYGVGCTVVQDGSWIRPQ